MSFLNWLRSKVDERGARHKTHEHQEITLAQKHHTRPILETWERPVGFHKPELPRRCQQIDRRTRYEINDSPPNQWGHLREPNFHDRVSLTVDRPGSSGIGDNQQFLVIFADIFGDGQNQVPSGSTINSQALTLYEPNSGSATIPNTYQVY